MKLGQTLSFFGLGKLGLPLAALFARAGVPTLAIDRDSALVQRLRNGETPYREPGLEALLAAASPSIVYSTDARSAAGSDASIVLVATPSSPASPAFSSEQVEAACGEICAALRSRAEWRYHLFVIASTLHPGSLAGLVSNIERDLGRRSGPDFGVAYVPDFVALGQVIAGFEKPAFLLVGADDERALSGAVGLYRRVVSHDTPVVSLALRDAEFAKVAFNAFLCVKISFANMLAQMADRGGGFDLEGIAAALSLDPRIGRGLLRAGTPFGGACFPRDVDAFLHHADSLGLGAPLVRVAAEINEAQFELIERHVLARGPRRVAVLGLSFKAGTPVTAGSPAFELIRRFRKREIAVAAFDGFAETRAEALATFGADVAVCDTLRACLEGADAVLLCNPETEFSALPRLVAPHVAIVDPWSCTIGEHPGLVRIGRPARLAGSLPAAETALGAVA